MDHMIGKWLDNRYELLEVIGSGGMAVVYKAQCHRLNRLVAIKLLKSELAEDADFRRRFRDESQAVAMLSHPNIVSVYDVSRGETEYIVMELIDGITLKQYMERRGKLNWREALHFITQIMRGLSHAHSRGIIHCDIKPQNIMILRDGSVKVADFGIARLETSAQQTMTQQALGSVHYISPEQAKGDRTDPRSDIYSAGVVLYEMLTNRLPFEGDNAVSVALQHLSSVPLSPREIDPEVPLALEKICMKAMASNIDKRYPSAEAMIADLEEFRKNPDTALDFRIEDLRDKSGNEPTQHIPRVKDIPSARHPVHVDEPDDDDAVGRDGSLLPMILLVLLAVAICGAAIVGIWRAVIGSMDEEPVQTEFSVPYLIGKTIEEATQLEEVNGIFEIVQLGQRSSSEYPAGQIIEQTPQPGKVVRDNREISVFVSSGVKSDVMPRLINMEHRAAKISLQQLDLGLTIDDTTEEYSDTVTDGCVISTIPAEGETIKAGDTVVLVISKGRANKPVQVITLTNIKLETAEKWITDLGLVRGTVDTAYSETIPEGYVISQSIAPTVVVDKGSVINLVVSLGPEHAEPPAETGGETAPAGEDQPADDPQNTEGGEENSSHPEVDPVEAGDGEMLGDTVTVPEAPAETDAPSDNTEEEP